MSWIHNSLHVDTTIPFKQRERRCDRAVLDESQYLYVFLGGVRASSRATLRDELIKPQW